MVLPHVGWASSNPPRSQREQKGRGGENLSSLFEPKPPSSPALGQRHLLLELSDSDGDLHQQPSRFSDLWTYIELYHQLSWFPIQQTAGTGTTRPPSPLEQISTINLLLVLFLRRSLLLSKILSSPLHHSSFLSSLCDLIPHILQTLTSGLMSSKSSHTHSDQHGSPSPLNSCTTKKHLRTHCQASLFHSSCRV